MQRREFIKLLGVGIAATAGSAAIASVPHLEQNDYLSAADIEEVFNRMTKGDPHKMDILCGIEVAPGKVYVPKYTKWRSHCPPNTQNGGMVGVWIGVEGDEKLTELGVRGPYLSWQYPGDDTLFFCEYGSRDE